jgi:predicted nuclease of predicted toxin-antitoxin system
MEFKIDENLPVETAELLRNASHKATTVLEQNLGGSPDPDIAHICQREGLTLITLDTDFADIRTYPPEQYPGLIVLRLKKQDKPHVLDVVSRLIPSFSSEPVEGRLWIVEEERIRVRS